MKHNLRKAKLLLFLLYLGIILSGIVLADDQSGETYGAYPGAPTPVSGQPTPVSAYPSQPTPVSPAPSVQPTYMQTQPAMANGAYAAYPGTPSSTSSVTAVYYTQAPPATQQNVLLTYNIQAAPPTAVYYSGTYIPWVSFYQVFPANSPTLWVSTSSGWSWYATCPPGTWVQELMYVPYTGTMKFYDLNPDGTTKYYTYGWTSPGYKYRWFYAPTPGRYISMLTVSDNPSNYVTIDVA